LLRDLAGLIQPLRVDWMYRRGVGIVCGSEPVSAHDIAAVTNKRGRRLVFDAARYLGSIFVPEYLDDIYDFPDGKFSIHQGRRNTGIGFKMTDRAGHARLFWIKRRDLARFANSWQQKILEALRTIAISPERYANHPYPISIRKR